MQKIKYRFLKTMRKLFAFIFTIVLLTALVSSTQDCNDQAYYNSWKMDKESFKGGRCRGMLETEDVVTDNSLSVECV
jgi:hypothetical protein